MQLDLTIESLVLGFIQGITEWLPISSEGLVALVSTLLWSRSFENAITLALWLHLGTAFSAITYFRKELQILIHDSYTQPIKSNSLLTFIIISSLGTALTGIPLLISINSTSALSGSIVMIVVGSLVLLNGTIQRSNRGSRTLRPVHSFNWVDAALVGLIQGTAIIPGLSRSGLTVSFLLFRKYDNRNALFLSFLMSIPASFGAVLLILITKGFSFQIEEALGAVVAFVIGLLTIRLLISFASRIKFSKFLITAGFALILGGILGLA